MAYQINLTGQEIDERLQNVGTAEDAAAADGTLYARIKKNADDIDELSDAVGHIESAQTATDKVVTQNTSDISTLQKAVSDVEKDVEVAGQAIGMTSASVKFATDPTNPVAAFKISDGLSFAGDSHIDYTFKLFRHTGCRYEEYPLWVDVDVDSGKKKKIPYTILVDKTDFGSFKTLNIQHGETTESLRSFILDHSKRKKWAIQAYVNGYPYTPLFEFAMSEKEIVSRHDLSGSETSFSCRLQKNNGSRFTPRRQNIRLAYAYDSYYWDKVGDAEEGLIIYRRYNFSAQKEDSYYKMPEAGDIVRRSNKAEGTVMYVKPKADDSFEMVWSENKKVYTMEFSTYIFRNADTGGKCTGMRITKAATLICDDITNQTKGGTLRDLYISAGAVYNEATGYYELNGLTDITEEEMRVIYEKTWGWWLHLPSLNGFGSALPRTNIPCPDYKIISYASNISLNSIFATSGNDDNLEVVNLRALYTPTAFDEIKIVDFNWAFQRNKKTKEVQGIINVEKALHDLAIGGNLETINIKGLQKNIRFYNSQRLSKESVLYMINNSAATSAITIGLQQAVYDVMKDDADIIAALAEKTNITLIQNT